MAKFVFAALAVTAIIWGTTAVASFFVPPLRYSALGLAPSMQAMATATR